MGKLLLSIALVLYSVLLSGQCPDRGALRDHIIDMRDVHKADPALQLKELLGSLDAMRKCHFTDDSVYALLLQRIGALYGFVPDYDKAISFTHAAIGVIRLKNNREYCLKLLAKCYYNLSVYYHALNLVEEKNNAVDSFLLVTLPASPGILTLYMLSVRVDNLFNSGDYRRCVHFAELANSILFPDTGQIRALNLNILTNKLNALIFLKQYQQARLALEGREPAFLRSGNPTHLGNLYSIQADINKGLGNYAAALQYFRKAYAIHLKTKDPRGCAQTLNDMGFLYLSGLHDPVKALTYFRSASTWQDSVESLNILDNIANAYVQLQQYDSAFHYFQKGLDQLAPGLYKGNLASYSIGDEGNIVTYLVELLLNKGDACLKIAGSSRDGHMLKQAIDIYKATDKLLDRVRIGQAETGSKLFWRSDNHRLYDHAIEACYAAKNTEDAFYFFEKSRAVLLNDRLRELSLASQDDLLLQAQAQRTVQALEKELDTIAISSPRYRQLQADLFRGRQQLQSLSANIRTHVSARQPLADTAFAGMGEVQRKIGHEELCLLELFAGDSALYTLTLTASAARMNKIPKPLYDSLSVIYSTGLTNPVPTKAGFDRQEAAARRLYSLLFPDQGLLATRVVISPDGHYFPFESLLTNPEGQASRFFIEDHAVSYTYSVRYWQNPVNDSPGAPASREFLGIAPVNYASYQRLPALRGSDRSLKALSSYFNDWEQQTGARASLHNFQQSFYKFQVLQLYTHASSQSVNGHPTIYFADSALSLAELIPENRPLTRLVVLSACETATGAFHQGEGIFSFSREFAALGIPASIANLWSVDNQATYRLTELFYKYLSAGEPTDIALQKAKKEFLLQASREQRLPYYWAAPILTGKPVQLTPGRARIPWILLILAIPVGALIWAGLRRMKSKRAMNISL